MEANLRSERRDPPCWQKLFETGERVLCKLETSSHTDFFAISKQIQNQTEVKCIQT